MNKKSKRDYATILIWAAAGVMVVRYAGAFITSDVGEITGMGSSVLTFFMGLTGIGMGLLDVIGGAYLFDGWRRRVPKNGDRWSLAFKVLTFFVFALIFVGVSILVPFTVSRILHISMGDLLGNSGELWWWSVLVNIAPYLLIGGVVVGNSGVVGIEMGENERKTLEKLANFPKDWRNMRDEHKRKLAHLGEVKSIMMAASVTDTTASAWLKRLRDEGYLKE